MASLPVTAAAEAPLDDLRAQALHLVNEARRAQDLAPLERSEGLTRAAQRHAEDMLARRYFAHESPEGGTVLDRFIDAGGSQWVKVAENIARCQDCGSTAVSEDVRRFHEGWMESDRHRANILDPELQSFGFGIAARDGRQYAVQTFAGPGTSLANGDGSEQPLPPDARDDVALKLINDARAENDRPMLAVSPALTDLAQRLLERFTAEGDRGATDLQVDTDALYDELPPSQRQRWRALSVIAGACGGCGARPTEGDVRFFQRKWMDTPQYRDGLLDPGASHIGFALTADGQGRKTAVAVFGRGG